MQFEPFLADKREALDKIEMGGALRITLGFEQSFWTRDILKDASFLQAESEDFPTWWTALPYRIPRLTGWVGGPRAWDISRESNHKILERALRSLSRMFGRPYTDIKDVLTSWQVHNWQMDPYSRGAYSYIGVRGMDMPEQLAAPIAQTLFFAGEATWSKSMSGTVDAALASGERAAREVLQQHAEVRELVA